MDFPTKLNIDRNVSLSEFTRIQIGGRANYLANISNQEELIDLVRFCRQKRIKFVVLGQGSNVFFADSGFNGLVAVIRFDKLKVSPENVIVAEAGAPLSSITELCIKKNFTGFEFSSGIPGTVGGAIYGNAGAYGNNVGECLKRAKILTPDGETKWTNPESLKFSYRYSALKKNKNILLEAEFVFPKGDAAEIQVQVDEILKLREQKLPPENIHCAGSYFKNIKDKLGNPIAAAKYLEKIGSRSICVGNAAIYHKHANIIINKGNATANDVLKLEHILKSKVFDKFKILLEREVVYIKGGEIN